jgi:hypothetical protein
LRCRHAEANEPPPPHTHTLLSSFLRLLFSPPSSFHNFDYIFTQNAAKKRAGYAASRTFDTWLLDTLGGHPGNDEGDDEGNEEGNEEAGSRRHRLAQLAQWEHAPSAQVCQPPGGASHFMPLLVVAGAADGGVGRAVFDDSHSMIVGAATNTPDSFAARHFEFAR